jgi:hypothetical protein
MRTEGVGLVKRENWPVGDHGIRPISRDEQVCTYCRQPRGDEHKADCAIRQRTVVVRLTVEYVCGVGEDRSPEQIEFHFNEGTSCLNNEIDRLHRLMGHWDHRLDGGGGCFCPHARGEYVREATERDEEIFDVRVANFAS